MCEEYVHYVYIYKYIYIFIYLFIIYLLISIATQRYALTLMIPNTILLDTGYSKSSMHSKSHSSEAKYATHWATFGNDIIT